MLSKLLKKDFHATRRFFIPLMLGFILCSILCKILMEITFFSPIMGLSEILDLYIHALFRSVCHLYCRILYPDLCISCL